MRRIRSLLLHWIAHRLYRIADVLDPGVEHEHYVCPECRRAWRWRAGS